jgi:hypothetical protein
MQIKLAISQIITQTQHDPFLNAAYDKCSRDAWATILVYPNIVNQTSKVIVLSIIFGEK